VPGTCRGCVAPTRGSSARPNPLQALRQGRRAPRGWGRAVPASIRPMYASSIAAARPRALIETFASRRIRVRSSPRLSSRRRRRRSVSRRISDGVGGVIVSMKAPGAHLGVIRSLSASPRSVDGDRMSRKPPRGPWTESPRLPTSPSRPWHREGVRARNPDWESAAAARRPRGGRAKAARRPREAGTREMSRGEGGCATIAG
jgi:hypothetical protein